MGIFAKQIDKQIGAYQRELIETHYAEVENMYRQIRGWRHDYRNHIQVMKAYAAAGDMEAISKYLDALDTDLATVDTVIKTGNAMADAILNSKISLAKSRGIPVRADAHIPLALKTSELDLCVIIGNLFDNAIEASMELPEDQRLIRVYMDMKNKMDIDDGEQDGQTSHSYHIEMSVSLRVPVPKFYVYYDEGKIANSIAAVEPDKNDIGIYSMKVFDIPEINHKGWVQYGTANFIKEKDQKFVEEIDITELFKAPVGTNIGTSLDDLITESIHLGISPSRFIDVAVYTNDMNVNGRMPAEMDWENRKIILQDKTINSYFYLSVYTDNLYVNDRILEKDRAYDSRISHAAQKDIEQFPKYNEETGTGFRFRPVAEIKRKK